MFCPEGFTTIVELRRQFLEMEMCTDKDVIAALSEIKTLFVYKHPNPPVVIGAWVMALHGTGYAFINPETGVISFDRLLRLAWNESHVPDGANYPATPSLDLTELVWKMKESHLHNRLPDSVPPEMPKTLKDFEDCPLCVKDEVAVTILKNFAGYLVNKGKTKGAIGETVYLPSSEFDAFVNKAFYPNKEPTLNITNKTPCQKILDLKREQPTMLKSQVKHELFPNLSDRQFTFHWKQAVEKEPSISKPGRKKLKS